jgi:antirestriction protein ArdC
MGVKEMDGMQGGESAAKVDVKNEVAQRLIEAMERGGAPWQRPWSVQAGNAMRPINPTTQNGYRGINRVLLALSGRSSNLWMAVASYSSFVSEIASFCCRSSC